MTTITYSSGQRRATWQDGIVNGDELLVQLLSEAAVLAPYQRLSETGPDVMPELVTEGGAWAAGIYLGFDMDASQIPDVLQVPPGATDGYTPPDIEGALKRRAISTVLKHRPGGVDHDQEDHGDWSSGSATTSTMTSPFVDDAPATTETKAVEQLFEQSFFIGDRTYAAVINSVDTDPAEHDPEGQDFYVRGKIVETDRGEEVGVFFRNLRPDKSLVENVEFQIHDEWQGKGIGTTFLHGWEHELANAGYETVEIGASFIGRYVWSKWGYTPDAESMQKIDQWMRGMATHMSESFLEAHPEDWTVQDMAAFPGMKDFMVLEPTDGGMPEWHGSKPLPKIAKGMSYNEWLDRWLAEDEANVIAFENDTEEFLSLARRVLHSTPMEKKRRKIAKHLAGTVNDHDQSTHGRRGSTSAYGGPLVDQAIADLRQRFDLGTKIRDLIPEDVAELMDGEWWRPGQNDEKWQAWNWVMNSQTAPVPDELVDLVESEGLDMESQHDFWQRHATRRVLERMKGPNWKEDLAESLDTVKMHLDGSSVFVRADEYAVNQMMVDGAIFNQIGSGVSNGAYGVEQRMGVQEILFGYNEFDEDLDRVPIYGYAAPTPFGDVGTLGQYGEIAIEMNKDYKDSTTVTLGDSLDASGAKGGAGFGGRFSHGFTGLEGNYADLAAYPMTAPGVGILDNLTNRGLVTTSQMVGSPRGFTQPPGTDNPLGGWLGDIGNNYVEAQVHKPIDFDDVDIATIHVEIYSVPIGSQNYASSAGAEAMRDYDIVEDIAFHGIPVHVWYQGGVVAVSNDFDIDDGLQWMDPPFNDPNQGRLL